jgi:hypothetical protein
MRADDGAEVKVGGAERGDRWGEHAPQILVGSRRGEINELECRFKLGLCQVTTQSPIRWDNSACEQARLRFEARPGPGFFLVIDLLKFGEQCDAGAKARYGLAKRAFRRCRAIDCSEPLMDGQAAIGAGVVETAAERPVRPRPVPRRRGEWISAAPRYAVDPRWWRGDRDITMVHRT